MRSGPAPSSSSEPVAPEGRAALDFATQVRDRLARLDRALTPSAPRILAAILVLAAVQCWYAKVRGGCDFWVFHEAARRFLRGEPLYRLSEGYPFKYAPTIAALFIPFAPLPRTIASLAWNLLSAFALLRLMLWSARRLILPPSLSTHLAVFTLAAPFSLHLFSLAQSDAALLWLAVESEQAADERPWLSGALWALACLAKPPFLVLLPPAILRRQGKRVAALAILAATFAALPAVRYGIHGTLELVHSWSALLAATTPPLLCSRENQSVFAVACTYFARPGEPGFTVAVPALGAMAAGMLGWGAWSVRRRNARLGSFAAVSAALYLTAFLSPLGWRTNLIAAIPLLYVLVESAKRTTPPGARRLALGTALGVFAVQRLNYEIAGRQGFAWLLEHRQFALSTLAAAIAALGALAWNTWPMRTTRAFSNPTRGVRT